VSDEAILPSVAVSDEAILLPYVVGGDEGAKHGIVDIDMG
jgi:hypothetical protein